MIIINTGDITQLIEFLKLNIIPIATFLISLVTFIITFANFQRNKANITCEQIGNNSLASIMKPDRIDLETPDVYWQNDFRAIIDVIITNKSALPISIIEFTLNNTRTFNSYSKPGNRYCATTQPRDTIHNGVLSSGTEHQTIFFIDDKCLQPVLDIPPYTSIRGTLFFHFNDPNDVMVGDNTLEIITSRKNFVFSIKISGNVHSVLPLPDRILRARDEKFL
ncbi:hypothetical protein COM21_07970 [Bacillus toyonensis]|nr:hypothetical protein COM21_07970 [Bacillus toyonensis]